MTFFPFLILYFHEPLVLWLLEHRLLKISYHYFSKAFCQCSVLVLRDVSRAGFFVSRFVLGDFFTQQQNDRTTTQT